jgi:hypothetical protein
MLDDMADGSLGATSDVTVTLIVVSTDAGDSLRANSWLQSFNATTRVSKPSARTWSWEPTSHETTVWPSASVVEEETMSPWLEIRETCAARMDAPV